MDEITKAYIDEKFLSMQVDIVIHSENIQRYVGQCMDSIINTVNDRANQAIIHADSNCYDICQNVDMTREQLADHISNRCSQHRDGTIKD